MKAILALLAALFLAAVLNDTAPARLLVATINTAAQYGYVLAAVVLAAAAVTLIRGARVRWAVVA